jgi:hypothetical protein
VNERVLTKHEKNYLRSSSAVRALIKTRVAKFPSAYWLSGICGLAPMSVLRGITTILSSGPQLAPGGNWPMAFGVMSFPIKAKSPDSSSKTSGHPLNPGVCVPLRCGSGPNLRINISEHPFDTAHCQFSMPKCCSRRITLAQLGKKKPRPANTVSLQYEPRLRLWGISTMCCNG